MGVRLLHRIEAFELDARICRAESPIHCTDPLVALLLPVLNLLAEVLDSRDVVGQALSGQHREFDLGNIQPTGMLGGVMDLQPVREGLGLFRRKDFVERGGRVRLRLSITTTTLLASG
jgi:hypothetical protein